MTMNSIRLMLIFLFSLPSFASNFTLNEQIKVPHHPVLSNEDALGVDAVIIKGQWKVKDVRDRFQKASAIYKRECGIKIFLKSLKVVQWKYPGSGLFYDLNDYFKDRYFDGTQQFLEDLNMTSRPLAIFLDSFDDYMPKLATSFPKVSLATDSNALNTLWITNKVNKPSYLEKEPDSYSVLAHEIGHILLNESHVFGKKPNIMHHKLQMLNDDFTEEQCLKMKKNIKSFIKKH